MLLSNLLYKLYKIHNNRIRKFILSLIYRIEGDELYSKTLRRIFKDYHKVEIGLYTHGGCFIPELIDKYTKIGRYCSIARPIRIMNRNHPMEFKSTHALFFDPFLKFAKKDLIEYIPLTIGNDVWIGHNAIIMPHVKNISDGAVIGAGAVVNKDVPPYAIVVGNPARVVRYRFSQSTIDKLLASRWWEKSLDEIKSNIQEFMQPYENLVNNESQQDGITKENN